jgi:hypothetical protein
MNNKNEFQPVQSAVDKLLNVTTVIRRKKKNEQEKKRELFVQLVNSLEECVVRSTIMFSDFSLDLSTYDEKFLSVIDLLLYSHFGQSGFELVSWYIYERINPDGTQNHLLDESGNQILVADPYQLYDIVRTVNPNI